MPGDGDTPDLQNMRPTFLGTVTKTVYDGVNDDLLTAGLGETGLGAAAAPLPANPGAHGNRAASARDLQQLSRNPGHQP